MNLNKVFILGNVTRDPELRALPSGQPVCSLGLATNRFFTDNAGQKKQEAEFHNVVLFGKLADTASKYVTKGSLLLVEGRIKTSSWQGSDGVKKFRTEIIAETLQLGPRQNSMAGGTASSQKPYQTQQNNSPKAEEIPIIEENAPVNFNTEDPKSFSDEEKSEEIDVKDIPF